MCLTPKDEIDGLVAAFDRAWSAGDAAALAQLSHPDAVFFRNRYGAPRTFSPREIPMAAELREIREIFERTDLAGSVAQRLSAARDALAPSDETRRQIRLFQFLRIPGGWTISHLTWIEPSDGFPLPAGYFTTPREAQP